MNKPAYNDFPKVLYHPIDEARVVNNQRELDSLQSAGYWYEHPAEAQQKRGEFEKKAIKQREEAAKKSKEAALNAAKHPNKSRGGKVRSAEEDVKVDENADDSSKVSSQVSRDKHALEKKHSVHNVSVEHDASPEDKVKLDQDLEDKKLNAPENKDKLV